MHLGTCQAVAWKSFRRCAWLTTVPTADAFVCTLVAATNHYIVARWNQTTLLVGYHWLSERGRDTMVALPGLTLVMGCRDIAKSILLACACVVDKGMLPNRLPDAGAPPKYNPMDAILWFFEAVRVLWHATEDNALIRTHFYDLLTESIDWHVRGTRYGIKVDDDGLLTPEQQESRSPGWM